MENVDSNARRVSEAMARSGAYRGYSAAFGHPYPRQLALIAKRCLPELAEHLCAVPHAAGISVPMPASSSVAEPEEIEAAFIATFDAGAPQPACPPYEGAFREGIERSAVLVEVAEFYRHFGLNMAGTSGEQADHLRAELEFMHFLTLLEGEAFHRGREDQAGWYRLAQGDFLSRHLSLWVPPFAAAVREHGGWIYPGLADSLESFIRAEAAAAVPAGTA